jgi:hypothetical protein
MLMLLLAGCRYNLHVRLYRPRSASLLQTFTSWLTGMPAEFSDPKFPSYGEGREGENLLLCVMRLFGTWGCGIVNDCKGEHLQLRELQIEQVPQEY